jgi:dimethylamine/trimethylamine dehydrogenase
VAPKALITSLAVARDPRHEILFEPVVVGPKTLRNRFYQVPHCTGFGVHKPWSQAGHRSIKAEGGWAAVCTEFCSISPESAETPCRLWDDDDVRALGVMCDEVHAHGALAGVELHHGGVNSRNRESRLASIAPSQIAGDHQLVTPKAMEVRDIRRVQRHWAEAARRAERAGFDIVYVYGAHSYLPMQFLSPFYNRRTDVYGGSLERRARFWLETLEQVREAVGDRCAIASRIAVDALGPAGVEIDEGLAFIALADHLVDLWDVNVGSIAEWSKDSGSSRFFAEGYQLKWTGKVRAVTSKPIVGVGRLSSPDRMAEIIRSGVFDLVGSARQSIADPFLPQKISEGRLDDIRECTGNNLCTGRGGANHLGCTQNATAGEEYRRGWHPERFDPARNADRDVLVVGAGPAGLECAMVLGKRGMRRIHLVDAASEIGGCMRWIPRLPGLGEWARVVNYRRIQIDKLTNVEFIPRLRLDAGGVREYGAEIVVLATGARWAGDGLGPGSRGPLPGADAGLRHCLTPEQVMLEGKRPPGRRTVVYDAEGYFMGAGLAELLALEGFDVSLVTPHSQISPMSDETLEGPLLRRHLHDVGVAMACGVELEVIGPSAVEGRDVFGDPWQLETDAAVLVTQRVSDESLYLELAREPALLETNGIEALYRIGDCVAPQLVADAIFDGHRLAREIDSEDPSTPLPYRREHSRSLPTAPALAKTPPYEP